MPLLCEYDATDRSDTFQQNMSVTSTKQMDLTFQSSATPSVPHVLGPVFQLMYLVQDSGHPRC